MMHIYKWDSTLSTHHTNIDQDNHEIIRKAQHLKNLMASSADQMEIKEAADDLENMIYDHFEQEEMMQLYSHFSNYEEHKKSHARFLKALNRLIHNIRENPCEIEHLEGLDTLIQDKYFNHIKQYEKEAAKFILQRDFYNN
ncbi:bacteriohemerythrin [Fusibacter bizertensis]